MRYYGVDLLDYYRGRLSARRVRVLLEHLPPGSAVARARHGEAAGWGVAEHLLATIVDQLALANWMFAAAHTPEGAEAPPRPDPVPRPGLDPEPDQGQPPAASPAEIAAFLGPPQRGNHAPQRGSHGWHSL